MVLLPISGLSIDRRQMMAAGAALAVTGCDHPPVRLAPPAGGVDDVHVHLFNLADLPVRGFLNNTIVRQITSPLLRRAAIAVVDIAGYLAQHAAVTAHDELNQLRSFTASVDHDVPALATMIVAREDQLAAAPAGDRRAPDGTDLVEAYEALRQVLKPREQSDRRALATQASRDNRAQIYASAAMETPPPRSGFLRALNADPAGTVVRTLAWVYVMTRSRRRHLENYLADFAAPGTSTLLVNLLVDFDLWVDDTPLPGSGIDDQLAFWAALQQQERQRPQPRVDIRTFAPYCPLRHAVERRGSKSTLWQRIIDLPPGQVSGIKIYPPMGFWPSGNRGRPDTDYVGRNCAQRINGIGRNALEIFAAHGGKIGRARYRAASWP